MASVTSKSYGQGIASFALQVGENKPGCVWRVSVLWDIEKVQVDSVAEVRTRRNVECCDKVLDCLT